MRVTEDPAADWYTVSAVEWYTEGAAADWASQVADWAPKGAGSGSRGGSRDAEAIGLRTMGAGKTGLLMLGGGARTRSCMTPRGCHAADGT